MAVSKSLIIEYGVLGSFLLLVNLSWATEEKVKTVDEKTERADNIEIHIYDERRDKAFILAQRDLEFSGDEAQLHEDINLEEVPKIPAFFPVASEESKQRLLNTLKIMGVPESAFKKKDARWQKGYVLHIDEQPIFVACILGKPVAFIQAFVFHNSKSSIIAYFSTVKEYQGKGIGGRLLRHMIAELKKKVLRKLLLQQKDAM